MTTLLSKFYVLLLCVGVIFSTSITAQDLSTQPGDISVGAGLAIGTSAPADTEIGFNVNAYYTITDLIRAGANFTYYFVDDLPGVSVSASEFNIDGHYLFINEDQLTLYALAGIHIARVSSSVDAGEFGTFGASGSDTGINLGGGVEYDLGSVLLFAEPKASLSGFSQFNLTGGVRLRFN